MAIGKFSGPGPSPAPISEMRHFLNRILTLLQSRLIILFEHLPYQGYLLPVPVYSISQSLSQKEFDYAYMEGAVTGPTWAQSGPGLVIGPFIQRSQPHCNLLLRVLFLLIARARPREPTYI